VNKLDAVLVIVAGGKSSRMQRDKALLPFEGYNSLAQYQYERFKPFFSKVYISAKSNKFDFDVKVIEDCFEEASPLVALISIFETLSKTDEVFVLSVDAPFVTEDIVLKIYGKLEDSTAVVIAKSSNGLEPLCGVYRRSVLDEAKKMFSSKQHRLQTLLEKIESEEVFFSNSDLFMNLNYPKDYELAKLFSSKS
jgi:molybdopterin-guanine dinucleotide biosynthesis protein A